MLSLPVIIVGLLIFFAPGNFIRKSLSSFPASNLFDIIAINADSLSKLIARNSEGRIFCVVILFSLVLLIISYLYHFKIRYKKYVIIGSVVFFLVIYFLSKPLFTLSLFVIYGLFIFLVRKQSDFGDGILSIYISSIASLALLLVAPVIAGRSLLPFYFLMTIPITFSFVCANQIGYKKLICLFIMVIFPVAFFNAKHIYDGYGENYQANLVNHYKLASASYDLKHGHSVQYPIILYKLPNHRYAEIMPYERPLIEKWMKKYYSLPSDVSFIWK